MYIKTLDSKEFKQFVNSYPIKSIYQTNEYSNIMQLQNYETICLGLIENNKIIAATLLLIKKQKGFRYAYAPRGFLINYNDFDLVKAFTVELKKFLHKSGITAITLNPLIVRNIYDFNNHKFEFNPQYDAIFDCLKFLGFDHLGYNNNFEASKPRFESILELNKSEEQLFKNIDKKYRSKIRSAITNGLSVIKGSKEELNYLYEQVKDQYPRDLTYFASCFEKYDSDYFYVKLDTVTYLKHTQKMLLKYEELSTELYEKIQKLAKKSPKGLIDKKINTDKYIDKYKTQLIEATKLLKNNPDGIVIASALCIKQDNNVTVLIDGYNKSFKKLNAKHLLIWHLIKTYNQMDFKKLTLGGLPNIMIENEKFSGLKEFRLNFGVKVYEYIGDLELIISKAQYTLYKNASTFNNIKSKLIK